MPSVKKEIVDLGKVQGGVRERGDDHVQVTGHFIFTIGWVKLLCDFLDLFGWKSFKTPFHVGSLEKAYDRFSVHEKNRIPRLEV